MKFRILAPKWKIAAANQIKLMIAAHRECLWYHWDKYENSSNKPTVVPPSPRHNKYVQPDQFFGEAFGVARALVALNYGYFGSYEKDAVAEHRCSKDPDHNVKWWFNQITEEYLVEEGFYDGTCCQKKCLELLAKYRNLTEN